MKIVVENEITVHNPPDKLVTHMEGELTFPNPVYANVMRYSPYTFTRVPEFISLLRVKDGAIMLPRGVDLKKAPALFSSRLLAGEFIDKRHSVPATFPEPQLTLNDEQSAMLKAAMRALKARKRPTGTFLFVASTSTGKTILQATVAEKLGQKTLVLCKTNLIRSAWQADLMKLYGLTKKQIGLIQQQTYRIGEQFTLSSLATLHRRKEKWPEIFANFGTIILDEVHLLPEDSIMSFVKACPCKYVVGATATISKKDEKKHKIVYNYFGPPVKELEAVMEETATSLPIADVKEVRTCFSMEEGKLDFDYMKVVEQLVGNDDRNSLIAKHVYEDWIKGHCVLVTTNRVAHAELLAVELEELGITDVNVLTGSNSTGKRYQQIVQSLNEGNIKCIVATDQLISVGANLPPIDRLHVAIPIADADKFKQLLGRIRRKSPATGKKDAKVCYYLDKDCGYLFRLYKRTALNVFREMRVPRYERMFMA